MLVDVESTAPHGTINGLVKDILGKSSWPRTEVNHTSKPYLKVGDKLRRVAY
ncbi:MAG: hypothetical protein QXI27_02980 [Nitrososphaerota archaeon]